MDNESDPAFVRRMLSEIARQSTGAEAPAKVTLAGADVARLVKLYAGVPNSALAVN